MSDITRQDLIDFVVREARLLDAKRYEEWNALFADDGYYWVPLVPDQEDGTQHTSHLYEDKLLRELRIERLKSPRAFSQQPPSRSHHLLQTPTVEEFDSRREPLRRAQRVPLHRVPGRRAAVLRRHGVPSPRRARRRAAHRAQAREPPQLRRRAARGAVVHLSRHAMNPSTTMTASFAPQERVVPVLLERQAARYGDRPLFVAGAVRWSYRDVVQVAAGYGAALLDAGIRAGDRVALLCSNRAEFMQTFLGCAWIGAVAVPINTASRGAQLRHVLVNSGARLLVAENQFLDAVRRARCGRSSDGEDLAGQRCASDGLRRRVPHRFSECGHAGGKGRGAAGRHAGDPLHLGHDGPFEGRLLSRTRSTSGGASTAANCSACTKARCC